MASVTGIHKEAKTRPYSSLKDPPPPPAPSFGQRNWGNNSVVAMLRHTGGTVGVEEGQKQSQATVPANFQETEVARPVTGRANKFS